VNISRRAFDVHINLLGKTHRQTDRQTEKANSLGWISHRKQKDERRIKAKKKKKKKVLRE
jgi:hypothetical protein